MASIHVTTYDTHYHVLDHRSFLTLLEAHDFARSNEKCVCYIITDVMGVTSTYEYDETDDSAIWILVED
jgi:hypothetical protein